MKQFTTADIRSWGPCYNPSRYLAETWRGTALDILNDSRIPFKDRLWVIMRKDLVSEKLMRRFAVWCARQVQHIMTDKRSLHALDVAEAYVENRWLLDDADYAEAWECELGAAEAATLAVAWVAAGDAAVAAQAAVRAVAWVAARDAAWAAAKAVARDGVRVVASWAAARNAAEAAQEQKLREMLIEGIETGDTK
jgi:hypothetical protein